MPPPSQEHEKKNSKVFEYSHWFREQGNKCCIEELCITFGEFLQVQPQDTTIAVWITAFTDSITPRSLIFPMSIGREIRAFGSDLALSSPVKLFKAHEWLKCTHFRPQLQAHAWLAAVAVFGPLFYHTEDLCAQVANAMHTSDDNNSSNEDNNEVQIVLAKEILDAPNPAREEQSFSDDASKATAPAGAATLHQQKIAGKDQQHQVRYDVKFYVPPSKAADKTMIAAAKKSSLKLRRWMTPL
jgi:hypothetical protein